MGHISSDCRYTIFGISDHEGTEDITGTRSVGETGGGVGMTYKD